MLLSGLNLGPRQPFECQFDVSCFGEMTIIPRVVTNEPIQTKDNRKKKKMSLQTFLNVSMFT